MVSNSKTIRKSLSSGIYALYGLLRLSATGPANTMGEHFYKQRDGSIPRTLPWQLSTTCNSSSIQLMHSFNLHSLLPSCDIHLHTNTHKLRNVKKITPNLKKVTTDQLAPSYQKGGYCG